MAAHLDNDHIRISVTVGSGKSKNVNLESKVSLELFPNTNSTVYDVFYQIKIKLIFTKETSKFHS